MDSNTNCLDKKIQLIKQNTPNHTKKLKWIEKNMATKKDFHTIQIKLNKIAHLLHQRHCEEARRSNPIHKYIKQ